MNTPEPIPVATLLEAEQIQPLQLRLMAGQDAVSSRLISSPRVQKPGLALAGYLPYVKRGTVQVLGRSEFEYLATLNDGEGWLRVIRLVECEPPLIVCTKGHRVPDVVLKKCEELNVPIATSLHTTAEVMGRISTFLEEALAPWEVVHGVLVEVFGTGTLITGPAGIGKSECALELIRRGHRLVADDAVVVKRIHASRLKGMPHEHAKYILQLRGVGFIDVRNHFGLTATATETEIDLVVRLERLEKPMQEDATGILLEGDAKERQEDLLGVKVPLFAMAVVPGRDVASMVETAVRKCQLSKRGVDDEAALIEQVDRRAAGEKPDKLP